MERGGEGPREWPNEGHDGNMRPETLVLEGQAESWLVRVNCRMSLSGLLVAQLMDC